ncbi:spore germination protein [Paenibacillus sp. MWE-103]|uniref:Spore germination protein n=1 Tax=Paenibacillus artemisiicola TaxID=1172618 RepID=A0ABS3W5G0_9BACL|nr:spore germination protein [Paenibacillus artemisiicola]MBO7743547.1 spore germination protein [Paenibacillus artemisiicola]
MDWTKLANQKLHKPSSLQDAEPDASRTDLGADLSVNRLALERAFRNCSDIVYRELPLQEDRSILLVYVDGMIDVELIAANVLQPLLYKGLPQGLGAIDSIAKAFEQQLFAVLQIGKSSAFGEIVTRILKGDLAVLADGEATACLAGVKQVSGRGIEESTSEPALRGPKESFTESLRQNTVLLRMKFATPKLKLEAMSVGSLTQTDVALAYLDGIADPDLLDEVRARVARIEIDGILDSGYIEEAIEDTHYSPFPQIMTSERPDVVAAGLLEGKVVVIADGTPFALIVPMTFWSGLQAPDDYYERFLYVVLNRSIRYFFAAFSVLLPSFYIALTNFHQELIPGKLMITIAALRERAPFPTVIEVLMMEVMFEGLREAGLRLPKPIGPLVSVVGALVIGEAAVSAGIVSSPIVIVVSAAGIASFIIPRYRFGIPLRMLRFPLLVLSGMYGLFGLTAGVVAILIHLVQLRPFGMPYLSPLAPAVGRWLKDWWIRWPQRLTKRKGPVPRDRGGEA